MTVKDLITSTGLGWVKVNSKNLVTHT